MTSFLYQPAPFEVDDISYIHDSQHMYQTNYTQPEKDRCPFFSIKEDDGPCAAYIYKSSDEEPGVSFI